MIWTIGHEEWGARLIAASVVCALFGIFCFLWPLLAALLGQNKGKKQEPPKKPNPKNPKRFGSIDNFIPENAELRQEGQDIEISMVGPTGSIYSAASAKTRVLYNKSVYASVDITPIRAVDNSGRFYTSTVTIVELSVGGVYFGIDESMASYYLYESETNQTDRKLLTIQTIMGFNTLSLHQRGNQVDAWLNNAFIETFTKREKIELKPVVIQFKAYSNAGGTIRFENMIIEECPSVVRQIYEGFKRFLSIP